MSPRKPADMNEAMVRIRQTMGRTLVNPYVTECIINGRPNGHATETQR